MRRDRIHYALPLVWGGAHLEGLDARFFEVSVEDWENRSLRSEVAALRQKLEKRLFSLPEPEDRLTELQRFFTEEVAFKSGPRLRRLVVYEGVWSARLDTVADYVSFLMKDANGFFARYRYEQFMNTALSGLLVPTTPREVHEFWSYRHSLVMQQNEQFVIIGRLFHTGVVVTLGLVAAPIVAEAGLAGLISQFAYDLWDFYLEWLRAIQDDKLTQNEVVGLVFAGLTAIPLGRYIGLLLTSVGGLAVLASILSDLKALLDSFTRDLAFETAAAETGAVLVDFE